MSSPVSSDRRVSPDRPRRPSGPSDQLRCGVGASDPACGPAARRACRRPARVAAAGSLAGPPHVAGHRRPAARFRLWNGEELQRRRAGRRPGDRVHDRPTLWKLLLGPTLHFGDAYTAGRLEVEGDLLKMLEAAYRCGTAQRRGPLPQDASAAGSAAPAPTPWPARGRTSTTITTSATTSTGSGSTRRWSTPAAISPRRRPRWKRRSGPRWTTSAASCGCGRAKRWSRRAAAGAPGAAHGPALRRQREGLQRLARADQARPAAGTRRRPRRPRASSSRTTTATSAGSSTPSSPWACWSTSGPTTTASWARPSTAASAPPAAD